MTRLALGGYGPDLGVVELDGNGFGEPGAVAKAHSASYLVMSADARFAYATLESADGRIGAWAVEQWRTLGEQPSGGADPCHLALSPDGRWLVTANYTSGSVGVHPVGDDGSLGDSTDLVQHEGDTGPVTDRQDGPHAHQVVFVDDTHLLVCDLGLDVVLGYELGREGRLSEVARSPLAPGTGPRHLALAGDVAYVVGELASTVTVCRRDGLVLEPVDSVSSRTSVESGENTAAGVVVVGDQVIASNRGDDSVVIFDRGGGGLRPVQTLTTGGSWPRWIGVVENLLLVGDERSDQLTAFARGASGWERVDELRWPSPTCAVTLP